MVVLRLLTHLVNTVVNWEVREAAGVISNYLLHHGLFLLIGSFLVFLFFF